MSRLPHDPQGSPHPKRLRTTPHRRERAPQGDSPPRHHESSIDLEWSVAPVVGAFPELESRVPIPADVLAGQQSFTLVTTVISIPHRGGGPTQQSKQPLEAPGCGSLRRTSGAPRVSTTTRPRRRRLRRGSGSLPSAHACCEGGQLGVPASPTSVPDPYEPHDHRHHGRDHDQQQEKNRQLSGTEIIHGGTFSRTTSDSGKGTHGQPRRPRAQRRGISGSLVGARSCHPWGKERERAAPC